MRDIGPKGFIAIHKLEGWPKAFALNTHPKRVDIIGRKFAGFSCLMQFALKIVKGDLPDNCVDHIFHFSG